MSNVFRVITGAKTMGEFAQSIDDSIQYTQLIENGTLCYECGEVVESAVITNSNVLYPAGKPCLCNKCKNNRPMETNYSSNLENESFEPVSENSPTLMYTNYNNELENEGFEPVYNKEDK